MANTFVLTLFFIVLTTVIGAFMKGRSRDGCLMDFKDFPVTIEMKDGKTVWGNLLVEATGIELIYDKEYIDQKNGHVEKSYILYKNEFSNINIIVRYHDSLDDKKLLKRKKMLKRYYYPKTIYPLGRRIRNFFYTVKDALMDVITLLVGRIRSTTPAGGVLSGQDKYVSQIQQQAIIPVAYAFEPLLERYIGNKVILKVMRGEKPEEHRGILKDYTPDFMELLDVAYRGHSGEAGRKADIIVSRQIATVRHLGK